MSFPVCREEILQPLIAPEARKERSCQSFSASNIGPRAGFPFHRPAFFCPAVGCASAVIFDADSVLCLSYVRTWGPKRNLDHRSFFSLDRYVNEFIQIISVFERSSFKLRCETVIGIVLCCCHQA